MTHQIQGPSDGAREVARHMDEAEGWSMMRVEVDSVALITRKPAGKAAGAVHAGAPARPGAPRGGPKNEGRVPADAGQRLVGSAPNTRGRGKQAEAAFEAMLGAVDEEVDRQLAAEAEAASGW